MLLYKKKKFRTGLEWNILNITKAAAVVFTTAQPPYKLNSISHMAN